jgi:pimeloyl-ACP methyl ester carboxylesterase
MTNVTVHSGNAEIAVETFGKPSDPPVLLIMGAMASMLWWPEEFCDQLARRGCYVIRYDSRDTGLSTTWPVGEPGYSFADMVADAPAILDALGIRAVHVVGMSMGGVIAQCMALRYPDRVLTLTAISTSPLGIKDLPPVTEAYAQHSESGEAVDWGNRADAIDFMMRDARALASTAHPHDAEAAKLMSERDIARARSFASATNHFRISGGEEGPEPVAADIRVPVLVIHGTSDPIFPIEHGLAFVKTVPNARWLPIEGGGHELHRDDWPVMIDAIASHTQHSRDDMSLLGAESR